MGALADLGFPEATPDALPVAVTRISWLAHLHAARGLAILAIILVHSASTFSFAPHTFAASIGPGLRDASGFFMMISGYLFQHFAARFRYAAYLKQKAQTVILPYVIISSLAILLYMSGFKEHPWLPSSFFEQAPLTIAVTFILTGSHLGPLWFIPTLALYYLAAPIFFWIDAKPIRYWAIVPALLVSIAVPRALHDANTFQAAAHFAVAYLMGMAASRFSYHWSDRACSHAPLITAAAIGIYALGLIFGSASAQLAFKLPLFLAILALLLRFPLAPANFLNHLATISFGLFFVHGYVIAAVRMLSSRFATVVPTNSLGLLSVFLFVTLLSWAIVEFLKLLLGTRSRYIIGY